MPRIEDVLERESRTVDLEQGDFERLLVRRERKHRNRRIRAGSVGIIVVLAMGIILVRSLTSESVPANPPVEPQPAPGVSGALAYALDGAVYLADPDASNAVRIADGDAPDEGCAGTVAYAEPSWSPDGRYLAFERSCWSSGPSAVALSSAVVISDPVGTVVAEFPKDVQGQFDWSPDSTRLVAWEGFGRTIGVYGVDGERQASLPSPLTGRASGYGPHWMPDGSALLLFGYKPLSTMVLPLDGTSPYELSGMRIYSPDGTRVAIVGDRSTVITDPNGAPLWRTDSQVLPAWSPDGDRFTALNRRGDLVLVDLASGKETVVLGAGAPLPKNGDFNAFNGFSPQGDRILFAALVRGGYNSLYSIGVDGSDVRLLVDGAMQAQWRPR